MHVRTSSVPAALAALAVLVTLVTACSALRPARGTNLPPTVQFTSAPVSAERRDAAFYAYNVFWSGYDPDGRVDHFEYAVDPAPGDTTWVSTHKSDEVIFFRSRESDPPSGPIRTASEFHHLVLRAVDDRGAMSARVRRSFYSFTVAPTVRLENPAPNHLLTSPIAPSVRFHWSGDDPDGQLHVRPVKYRFRLFPFDRITQKVFLSDPDSLLRRERATNFAGWDSSSTDTTSVRYTNLSPRAEYLFALIGEDEAGALTPYLSLDENLINVGVTEAGGLGPRIRVVSEFVDFTYASGGYTADPLRWIRVEVPAGPPVRFRWEAFPSDGASIESYRWALDLNDLTDDTPRSDEATDVGRWSRPSPLTTECTLRDLTPRDHFLYIEARDNNGLASLAVVAMSLVVATLEKELLVVDDTRYELDELAGGCLKRYTLPWPSATELDTFLYARGGVPWRCTQEPASGALSPPGVLAGYAFDTLGTRQGQENPMNWVPLRKLGQYKNVIWMLDGGSVANVNLTPPGLTTLLRYASAPGRANMLGAYLAAGGRLWLMGGGAGTASMTTFNDTKNDTPLGEVYSDAASELVNGRLMHDAAHWRSEFSSTTGLLSFARAPRAAAIAAAPWTHFDRWSGGSLTAPDYRRLPAQLHQRSPALDPLPPTRTSDRANAYYRESLACEYLSRPNFVHEDLDPDEDHVRMGSVLDTLYEVTGSRLLRSPAPTMTWYHGGEADRAVFSGFAPWEFRRDECAALFDFVLHDLWGLERRAAPAPARATAARTAQPRGAGVLRRE